MKFSALHRYKVRKGRCALMVCGVILSVLATLNSQQMIDSYRLVVV